jgi:divalent metal cation (Fe/Co/Zn/Cd) transporter
VVGAIILVTDGWYWLDPAVALTIAVVVAYHALVLIRKVLTRLRPRVDGAGGRSCRG